MECVIIEDLPVAADYLQRCCEKCGTLAVRGRFADVTPALEFLHTTPVDLLFLDVEMPGATGFDLLDQLAYRPAVILTTSKEEYAYNAFQYRVTDFLKKPFTYPRFLEALEKTAGLARQAAAVNAEQHLFIKTDGKLVRLTYDDILYVESMGDYVRFVTADKKYMTSHTIKSLEDKLDTRYFMRVHRSFIINVSKIDDIRESDVFINGREIPVSRNMRPEILKKLTIL